MDEALKRRLMGAALITLLAIIIVPMFFEDKSRKTDSGDQLPLPVERRSLALPRDSVPAPVESTAVEPETRGESKRSAQQGFKIIQLNDEPVSPPVDKEVEPPVESDDEPLDEIGEAPPEVSGELPKNDQVALEPPTEEAARPARETPKAATNPVETRRTNRAKQVTRVAKASPSPTPDTKVSRRPQEPVTRSPEAAEAVPAPATPARERPKATITSKKTRLATATTPQPAVSKTPTTDTPRKSEGGSGWAVQAGSFAFEVNARNLADKLRKRNLPVQVDITQTASGPLYRVIVPSVPSKERAEQVQKELESRDGIRGLIYQKH